MLIRIATPRDDIFLAELRWIWESEHTTPACTLTQYQRAFVFWAHAHRATHSAYVVEADGRLVAMAWLFLANRVPTPGALHRFSGDVQSVYVRPELRGQGIGARLIHTVIVAAAERGLNRLTVHAGTEQRPFYLRLGFAVHDHALETDPRTWRAPHKVEQISP